MREIQPYVEGAPRERTVERDRNDDEVGPLAQVGSWPTV